VITAELQAVLNFLTENNFQEAFKKVQKHWEQSICVQEEYFEGDSGQKAQS
jgi:hypothetical protein